MFKKKGKNEKIEKRNSSVESFNLEEEEKAPSNILTNGIFNTKDYIAPSFIDRSDPTKIVIGDKHIRSFSVQGFPSVVSVGWLNDLYNYNGDMDVALHIAKIDDSMAINELTSKIVQYESQLAKEEDTGNIKNTSKYRGILEDLYRQRAKLERNIENIYHVQVTANLCADSADILKKESQKLENRLKGRKIMLRPNFFRQDEGFNSAVPLGECFIPDMYRNFNSGGVTACFPFYNSDLVHPKGVLCGRNMTTGGNLLIDFYDKSVFSNANITVMGPAGTGKTYFVSLLTARSALRGIRTAIVDPEGEYRDITKTLGGKIVKLSPLSNENINPFDIEEEDVIDDDTDQVIGQIVNIKSKVSDVLNLIAVMAGGLNSAEVSIVASLLQKLYENFGFTEDPASLYTQEPAFDKQTMQFFHYGLKKPMPTFSDFYKLLKDFADKDPDNSAIRLKTSLSIFQKGSLYGMFDTQTSENLLNFDNSIIVDFDVKDLEENILRPIGMYVALSWISSKFVNKDRAIRKRVVVDEAWMLMSENMPGHEYTAAFVENTSRRIRKRNGGLLTASQNFSEFASSKEGQAVLTNSVANIFMKQKEEDIDSFQEKFKLSNGEKMFLLQARRGEALFRFNKESFMAKIEASQYEHQLITAQLPQDLKGSAQA